MKIKKYGAALLKDRRRAVVVEVLSEDTFIVDIGSSPKEWDTITVTIDQIEKVI